MQVDRSGILEISSRVRYDMLMENHMTTAQAAQLIGCNDSRVRQLLKSGKIIGRRVGRDWLVDRTSAEAWRDSDRKPGRKPATVETPEVKPKSKK
ncbi:helix-turn-helix domain-containing protein [Gemmata sp.]|uniref:helix-turn-helix domain-containing protein n=1 Tax=Gemmata sp. TaxID=1914242 RepID=UPI003F703FDA